MLIRLSATASAMPCRPAFGYTAAMLVLAVWGGVVGSGKPGSASAIAGFYFIKLISLINILVTILGLLNRIQGDLPNLGGQFRRRPELT